ncbi:unnamed protein product [Brachionus calyciflorus]|uniref:Uncharacterized protein n=1 Tax=Brachionus calyciflorus TaxID=104777 RepID=A0A814AD62_9BILA|nr:unnamed protein product [Brachionus calyciflorus]
MNKQKIQSKKSDIFVKKIHSSSKLVQYLENQTESNNEQNLKVVIDVKLDGIQNMKFLRLLIELSHEMKIVSSSLYPCLKTIESHLNGILKNGGYEFLYRALDGMMGKCKKYHQKVVRKNNDSSNKSKKKESIVSLTQQYLAEVTKTKATNEDEIDRFFKKTQVEYCPNYDVLGYWKEN